MFITNSQQIREADRLHIEDYALPGIILMEQAGKGAAQKIIELYPNQHHFVVLAGPGNNGGDGLVIARFLSLWGKDVRILYAQSPSRYQGDAAINYGVIHHFPIPHAIFQADDYPFQWFESRPLLIDALLGTGVQDKLRGTIASMVDVMRKLHLPSVAIDLPSGLSADSGAVFNLPIEAEHTLSFQLPKLCHHVYPAANYCGQTHIIDLNMWPWVLNKLSIKRRLLDDEWVRSMMKPRSAMAHKGSLGHLLIVGGSKFMAGAIGMTAYSALKSGAGLCTVLAPESCRNTVLNLVPEAMCVGASGGDYLSERSIREFEELLEGKDAVVIGPGMGNNAYTRLFLAKALPLIKVPLLLDADALNLIAEDANLLSLLSANTVMSPHPGEMVRLAAKPNPKTRRLEAAEQYAKKHKLVTILKGAGTIIALPDGRTYINSTGNPGMATAGSGDVLSGTIGALLAQGYKPQIAAPLAVYLHGKAGDLASESIGQMGLTATDIARNISPALQETLYL